MAVRNTQLPIEVVRLGDASAHVRATSVAIEVLAPFDTLGNDYNASASLSVIFRPRPTQARSGISPILMLTVTASVARVWDVEADLTIVLNSDQSHVIPPPPWWPGVGEWTLVLDAIADGEIQHRDIEVDVDLVIVFDTYRPRNEIPAQFVGDIEYIGRYQIGQSVPLRLATVDHEGAPHMPTSEAPTASVLALEGSQWIETVLVPRLHDDQTDTVFSGSLRLGASYGPGRYLVTYRWNVGGFTGFASAVFEVDEGGDREGPIVSAYSARKADQEATLAQLGSGRIVVGQDAYLDEGL